MTRQLLLSGFFIVGVLTSSPAAGTSAAYSTAVTSSGNQFTAGTLRISDSLAAGTSLSMSNLIAGDNFDAQLDITNSGTLSLIYAMTTTTTDSASLATALQLTVRIKSSSACAARDGTVIYAGSLTAAALGDPAHGVQTGDRPLTPGQTESLCFTVELPATASALLDKTAGASFVFHAEQPG